MIVVALVAVPLIGAGLSTLLQPGRAGRWAAAAILAEFAIVIALLAGGSARLANQSFVAFGTELALRPTGIFAVLIAAIIVVVAVAATREEAAPTELMFASLVGLGGVALISLLGSNTVAAALGLILLAVALSTTLGRDAATPTASASAQRFVTWLVLGASALVLSGALDRFYLSQPGPGIFGSVAALFVVGAGILLAAFPLTFWLPALASDAPIGAGLSAGLLGAATLSVLAGDVSGSPWMLDTPSARTVLIVASALAGVVSSLLALGQRDPARCLAFLVSASADFTLAILATAVPADPTAAVLMIGAQALASALGLVCLGAAKGQVIALARRRLPLALGLSVATLSLIGFPLTAGYVARWIDGPSLVGQYFLFLVAMAVASAIGGLAGWRTFGVMFDSSTAPPESWRPLDLAALATTLILIVWGVFPGPILALLSS